MDLTQLFRGKKTYAAAIGLLVAAYLAYQKGDLAGATQSIFAALAAAGLRSALADQLSPQQPQQPQQPTQGGPPVSP